MEDGEPRFWTVSDAKASPLALGFLETSVAGKLGVGLEARKLVGTRQGQLIVTSSVRSGRHSGLSDQGKGFLLDRPVMADTPARTPHLRVEGGRGSAQVEHMKAERVVRPLASSSAHIDLRDGESGGLGSTGDWSCRSARSSRRPVERSRKGKEPSGRAQH